MTSIVLLEDHQIFRQGLKALLSRENDLRVLADTGDGRDAVDLVALHKPDILVADLSLPGIDGLEVLKRVRSRRPQTKFIVLSHHDHVNFLLQAREQGAMAYILKKDSVEDLVRAIRGATPYKPFLSRSVAHHLEAFSQAKTGPPADNAYFELTPREREILLLVVRGFSSPDIGKELFISAKTVDKHRSNLMKKLGIHRQTELVHFAVQLGIYQIDL